MQITINVPNRATFHRVLNKIRGLSPDHKPVLDYGCYKDRDTNIWYSYWSINQKCYVLKTPEGCNAKEFARVNKDTVVNEGDSYDCKCEKCHGTGEQFGHKCYRCDGKGWMSPIDLDRYKRWLNKQATPATPRKSKKTA